MRRIRPERGIGPRGFSRWVNPVMTGYLMACCDCGLVHEMEFKAFRRGRVFRDGSYEATPLPRPGYGVTFRARRAEGHTANHRRKKGRHNGQ